MRESRLLAMLIMLQLRKRVTAEALAAAFEVSVRTIYRDIDRLSAAGVPVYGDKGHGGGFALHEGYTTRLTGLNRDEAEALPLIGWPQLAAPLGLAAPSARAHDKMQAAMPGPFREQAARINACLHLDLADWYQAASAAPFLPVLIRAILDQREIDMRYESWRGKRDWRARPLGLVLKGGHWYLLAEARARITTFRAAAILSLSVRDDRFERPADFVLATAWQASVERFEAGLRPHIATLRLTPLGARRLAEAGRYASEALAKGRPVADGLTEIDLPLESWDQGARLLLGLGPEFVVCAPEALRAAVTAICEGVTKQEK